MRNGLCQKAQLRLQQESKADFRPTCQARTGHTLLELLVVLAIVSIIAAGNAPSLKQLVEKSHVAAASSDLRKSIAMARNLAVSTGYVTTLCPQEANQCSGQWQHSYMLFIDRNNNARLDDDDELFETTTPGGDIQIFWRASGRASYLKFSPTGIARQFGRFHVCKKEADLSTARAMVINRQGRLRMYRDRDGNGIVEDVDGREPVCPD